MIHVIPLLLLGRHLVSTHLVQGAQIVHLAGLQLFNGVAREAKSAQGIGGIGEQWQRKLAQPIPGQVQLFQARALQSLEEMPKMVHKKCKFSASPTVPSNPASVMALPLRFSRIRPASWATGSGTRSNKLPANSRWSSPSGRPWAGSWE